MWFIVPFYMLRYLHPNPIFHLIASILYMIKSNSLKPTIASFAIFCMYSGFSLYRSLIEFCFVPYYIVSFYGLRNRDYYVFIGSILLGIHLYPLSVRQLIAHVMMNLGRSIPFKATPVDFLIAHLCLFLMQPTFSLTYLDAFAGISAFLVHLFPDNMDIFSASMMFDSMLLTVLPLHILELDWYLYFKNNHFQRVYESYNFILPLGVLLWALVMTLYT